MRTINTAPRRRSRTYTLAFLGLLALLPACTPIDGAVSLSIAQPSSAAASRTKVGRADVLRKPMAKRTTDIPDVLGRTLAQADRSLVKAGFPYASPSYKSSETVPKNRIIYQHPPAGTKVPAGTHLTVRVVISSGLSIRTVPSLIGVTLAQADLLLAKAGFSPGRINYQASESVPANRVISQSPGAGTKVQPKSRATVNVVVSSGKQSQHTTSAVEPNVVGDTSAQADRILIEAGFAPSTAEYAASATVPANAVISQAPPAGTRVEHAPNSKVMVYLVISSGPIPTATSTTTSTSSSGTTTSSETTTTGSSTTTESTLSMTRVVPVPSVVNESLALADSELEGAGLPDRARDLREFGRGASKFDHFPRSGSQRRREPADRNYRVCIDRTGRDHYAAAGAGTGSRW